MNDKLREAAHHSLEQWAEDEVLPPQPSVRRGYKRGFRAGYNRALAELTSDEMVGVAADAYYEASMRDMANLQPDAPYYDTRLTYKVSMQAALQAAAEKLGE